MRLKLFFSSFRTPFHSDVFGSYSWSANIYGRKRWYIIPPNESEKLRDALRNFPFSVTPELLEQKKVKYFDLIQEPGETLFIPSKWYHQVHNLDDAVSINHNWFNGSNALSILGNLLDHQDDVLSEISDCKDMENFEEHCQLMLKSSFGMNVDDFFEILEYIGNKRVRALQDQTNFKTFGNFIVGKNLMIHDLNIILNILEKLRANEVVIKFESFVVRIVECENKIKDALEPF